MILIQLDATGLKQGAEQVETATNKMNHALEKTAHHGNFLEHIFHHLKRELLGFTVSMIGFGAALEGIKSSFEYFGKIEEASEKLHVNVELLEAWQEAVVKAGGTAESFDQSLEHVAHRFNTSNQTVLKVLPQFANMFQRLSTTQAINYGKKLGFDEPTIMLLHQGGKAVDELIEKQKHLGVITQEQKETLDKYNAAWADTKQQLRYVTFETEISLLPALGTAAEYLGKFIQEMRDHSDFVKGAILAIAAAITYLGRASLIAWIEFLGPIALAIAGILAIGVAVGLVYEDVRAFMRGQESFIGNLIKEYPRLGKVILAVIDGIKLAASGLFWLWKKEFELFLKLIEKIEAAYSKVKGLFDKKYTNNFSSTYDPRLLGINQAKAAIAEVSNHPINGITSNSILYGSGFGALKQAVAKSNNVHIGEVNIVTQATDAQGISTAIGKGLYDMLFQAQSQLDDGMKI